MKKDKLLYNDIKQLIDEAKSYVVQNVNTTLVFTNYHIGRMIVENDQQGSERAKYAENTLKTLSKRLSKDFGRGYSVDNLQRMRSFYILYQNRIYATLSHKSSMIQAVSNNTVINQRVQFSESHHHFSLSWSHYSLLIKIENEAENKTVGLVLSKQTNKAVVEYTLPEKNDQIFAREYKLFLPSKKQLQNLLLK